MGQPAADEVGNTVGVLRRVDFDAARYVAHQPDLAALPDETALLLHFAQFGLGENRAAPVRSFLPALDTIDQERKTLEAVRRAVVQQRAQDLVVEPFSTDIIVDLLVAAGKDAVIVIGDSHSHFYIDRDSASAGVIHVPCSGGSASGLANPASRAGYGTAIRSVLGQLAERGHGDTTVLFQFGQVDTEFVYNFRRLKHDGVFAFDEADYLAFLNETAEAYVGFAAGLADIWARESIVLASIFPPALSDAAVVEGYVNGHVAFLNEIEEVDLLSAKLRLLQMPTLADRTRYHRVFNDRIGALCTARGLGFIDVFSRLLGDDGLIAPMFVESHGGADHHLTPSPRTLEIASGVLMEVRTITRQPQTAARSIWKA